jgi:hypothetical protein
MIKRRKTGQGKQQAWDRRDTDKNVSPGRPKDKEHSEYLRVDGRKLKTSKKLGSHGKDWINHAQG